VAEVKKHALALPDLFLGRIVKNAVSLKSTLTPHGILSSWTLIADIQVAFTIFSWQL